MTSPRQELGAALWQLADLVRADEGRRSFRSKAYRRAVWALDQIPSDLRGPSEEMLDVSGIGPGTLKLIEEFRSAGRLEALARLSALYPRDASRLRRLPRMTPALLRGMKAELGVDEPADLIAAVESGGIETLRGVGAATAERWAKTLLLAPSGQAVPSFQAAALADAMRRHLDRHLGGKTAVSGAVRRLDEWVDTIDLVAEVGERHGAEQFLAETAVARHLGSVPGEPIRLLSHDGVELAVHLGAPGEAGRLLVATTGPPDHVGPLLADMGVAPPTEIEIYERSGREWVPPPARGLADVISSQVVRLSEIRGDLHLHSGRSPDGRMGLVEIFALAVDRGYEYLLITDHTSGLRFGGLDEKGLLAQRAEIDKARSAVLDLTVLHGAELNIDRDGGLDISEEGLAILDMAVAGLHSHFDLGPEEQTARVLAALEHPVVRVLAHPTGRRIGIRPAVDLDIEAVIAGAIAHRVALEVNGHRDRLDLSAAHAGVAVERGALLAANSDAHVPTEIGNIANAVATMQKAGVLPASVVNTFPIERFRAWLDGRAPFPAEGEGV